MKAFWVGCVVVGLYFGLGLMVVSYSSGEPLKTIISRAVINIKNN